MPSSQYRMVIDDPSKIGLLTDDMKKLILQGAINTVNVQVALTRKNAIENIKDNFTLRNNFTTSGKNLNFKQANKNAGSFEEIEAVVGSVSEYMELQELGGKHVDKRGSRLAIPTSQARGGSNANLVPANMYIKNVRKNMYRYNPRKRGDAGKSNLVATAQAAYENKTFLKYNKNIYRVKNFEKIGGNVNFELEMVYMREFTETPVRATRWLERAAQKPAEDAQKIFNSQMEKLEKQ